MDPTTWDKLTRTGREAVVEFAELLASRETFDVTHVVVDGGVKDVRLSGGKALMARVRSLTPGSRRT